MIKKEKNILKEKKNGLSGLIVHNSSTILQRRHGLFNCV